MKRLTLNDFIQRANLIHDNKYDYSQVEYVNNSTKVKIICPFHGVFEQTPAKHLSGRGCPHFDCISEKRKTTNLSRFGVENPAQSDVIKQKRESTCLQKYGVKNPMQNDEVKESLRQSVQETYGVDYSCQADSVKQKRESTLKQKYGGNSPMCDETVREKQRHTMQELYGVESPLQSVSIRQQMINTLHDNYGVTNPMDSDVIRNRLLNTIRLRYGADSVLSSDEIRKKIQDTCNVLYGGNGPFASVDVQEKARETMLSKYGVENPMCSDTIRDRVKETNLRLYGFDNPMKNPDVQEKVSSTKRKNHTFNVSELEDVLYESLCNVFSSFDVERQYKSDVYPFACDFYIKSRDMYIELNGSWTHGQHWFGSQSTDSDILSDWQSKSSKSEYYQNAIKVWTSRDVVKRDMAKQNNLNYIVFWDCKLRDAELWFSMNCPDGQDWKTEYSWL